MIKYSVQWNWGTLKEESEGGGIALDWLQAAFDKLDFEYAKLDVDSYKDYGDKLQYNIVVTAHPDEPYGEDDRDVLWANLPELIQAEPTIDDTGAYVDAYVSLGRSDQPPSPVMFVTIEVSES